MIGARIAALRRQKKLSQQALARQVGVSPSAIGMYEQGRREPDCQTLVKLAAVLDATTDFLLTGQAQPREFAALCELAQTALSHLDGRLTLQGTDGESRPFDARELAMLLAALLG